MAYSIRIQRCTIYAIDNNLPIPIGTQSAEFLDASANDEDADAPELMQAIMDYDNESGEENNGQVGTVSIHPYIKECTQSVLDSCTSFTACPRRSALGGYVQIYINSSQKRELYTPS